MLNKRPTLRKAGKIATGVALGSALFGLHGDVNPKYIKKKAPLEFKQEKIPKDFLKDPEFKKELEKENELAKKLLRKYELKELNPKDVKDVVSSIKSNLIELQLNEPEVMRASIFDLKATIKELERIGEVTIDSIINAGRNFWNSPDSVLLAELIALATYLQLATSISRKRSFSRGFEKEPFSFNNFEQAKNPLQYPALITLAIFVANYSHLSLPIIFLNPSARYYLSKLVSRIKK